MMSRGVVCRGVVLAALAAGGCSVRGKPVEPLTPPWDPAAEEQVIQALEEAAAASSRLNDLTALLHRHEAVDGRLGTPQEIELKWRRRPFSLYMHWVDPLKAGAELLHVAGRNDNRVLCHVGGPLEWLLPTMRLTRDDPRIAKQSRHPLENVSPEKAVGRLVADIRRARDARQPRQGQFRARALGAEDVLGRPTQAFEFLLPDDPSYYGRRVRVWLDHETHLLLRIQAFDVSDHLLENFAFANLRTNVGLTEEDFNPRNPAYHFYRK